MLEKVLSSLERAYPKWVKDLLTDYEGTRLLSENQMKEILNRKNLPRQLHKKKNRPGIEDCIEYEDEFSFIYIFTSFVTAEGAFRKHDNGWVVLFDKRFPNRPEFFSFPLRRTKRFLRRLRKWFKAFWEICQYRHPPCGVCKEIPVIKLVRGDELHAVAYFCPNGHKIPNTSVYSGMSEESIKFVSGYFERYHKYRLKEVDEGRMRGVDRFRRANKNKYAHDDGVNYGDGGEADQTQYNDGSHIGD